MSTFRRAGVNAGFPRLPFNEIDEAFANASGDGHALGIEFEIHVGGRLDEERLRDALRAAIRLHPLAGARQVESNGIAATYLWEITGRADVDPLRVLRCTGDAQLQRTRNEFHNGTVPVVVSPPFRMLLVRGADADVLMVHVSHAASDGVGIVRLLRSVMRAYAGEADPVDHRDLPRQRSFERLYARPMSLDWLTRLPWIHQAQVDALLSPPSRISFHGATARIGSGVKHATMPTAHLRSRRIPEATANDLLIAGLMLAIERWNRSHGSTTRRISILMPLNLRPSHARAEMFGNMSMSAVVSTTAAERAEPAHLLRRVADQTRRIKRHPEAATMIDVYRAGVTLPMLLKRSAGPVFQQLTGHRFVPTALLSNLGKLDGSLEFGRAAATTAIFVSPPCSMPMGVAIGALSYGATLHLSFRHALAQMSEQAAAEFIDLFLEAVLSVR